jgi:3',5'-cyclic-AMP phosphodiesterase
VPRAADVAGIVSWVHFGDLHMTGREQDNHRDLQRLVGEVNAHMSDSISFVYLPGDNADHGTEEEYELVREAIDRLVVPWYAIVGDHDVHNKSLETFKRYLMPAPVYAFEVSDYRFLALNAFASENSEIFDLSEEQLSWLERALEEVQLSRKRSVLLLHCYPSDLSRTASLLRSLVHDHNVLLVDMGHTHYNEIAHDGHAIYTATRSTGQIEEGPVGFSVTNLDQGVVSWRFKPLGNWPFVMITTPADKRLISDPSAANQVVRDVISVRAKTWGEHPITSCNLRVASQEIAMRSLSESAVWTAELDTAALPDGTLPLEVVCRDASGQLCADRIRVCVSRDGGYAPPSRRDHDQDNALGAWTEHGIFGTQWGPNKNGRKW